jgi:hypothetical protein
MMHPLVITDLADEGIPVAPTCRVLEHPVLLGLEVRIVRLLPGLDHLKRDALLAEYAAQAFVADVVDHPLSHQELGQLRQAPGRKGQVVIDRARQRDLLISRRSGNVKVGGRPPQYLGAKESNPSALKLCSTARTRSGEVKATLAICPTSIPWAERRTIWARRPRTTEPEERRTI